MNESSSNRFAWFGRGLTLALVIGVLAGGCQSKPPPATDSKTLQQHADELKKQHEREKKNK
jgi:hypothetical protein